MDLFKRKWVMFLGIAILVISILYATSLPKEKYMNQKYTITTIGTIGAILFFFGGMFTGVKQ